MPTLMTKDDVMRTAVNLGRADQVWSETFDTASGEFRFSFPHSGNYQIVIMSVSAPEEENSQKKNIRFGLLKDKLKNRRRIGAMAGRWPDYSYERDREMDAEIAADCDAFKDGAL